MNGKIWSWVLPYYAMISASRACTKLCRRRENPLAWARYIGVAPTLVPAKADKRKALVEQVLPLWNATWQF
ncbi:MAG: hypothetical protein ACLUKN_17295 [Bacilli bacterium]